MRNQQTGAAHDAEHAALGKLARHAHAERALGVAQREHQAASAYLGDQLRVDGAQPLEAGTKLLATLGGVLQQVLVVDDPKDLQRHPATDVGAAERRQMGERAGAQEIEVSRAEDGGADRVDAARQRLADGHHVGDDITVLAGPHPAGAPHAALHLIEDQQPLVTIAEGAQTAQVLVAGDVHAALTLDGLDQDRADRVVHGGAHGDTR